MDNDNSSAGVLIVYIPNLPAKLQNHDVVKAGIVVVNDEKKSEPFPFIYLRETESDLIRRLQERINQMENSHRMQLLDSEHTIRPEPVYVNRGTVLPPSNVQVANRQELIFNEETSFQNLQKKANLSADLESDIKSVQSQHYEPQKKHGRSSLAESLDEGTSPRSREDQIVTIGSARGSLKRATPCSEIDKIDPNMKQMTLDEDMWEGLPGQIDLTGQIDLDQVIQGIPLTDENDDDNMEESRGDGFSPIGGAEDGTGFSESNWVCFKENYSYFILKRLFLVICRN